MAQNVTLGEAEQASDYPWPDSMAPVLSSSDLNPEAGMKPSILPMYSGPDDGSGQIRWQSGYPQDIPTPEEVPAPEEDPETKKWALIKRYTGVWGNPGNPLTLHSIVVQSPFIKSLLEEVLKGYSGVTVTLDRLEFAQPYVDFNFT